VNIFGVGGAELVLIILIMLLVAGPQRMMRWAYHIGRYTAILRKQWSQMMDVIQKEVDEAGMDIKVPRDLPTRQNVNKFIQDAAKPWSDQVEASMREVREPMQDAVKEINQVQAEANKQLNETNKQLKQAGKDLQQAGSWSGEKADTSSDKQSSSKQSSTASEAATEDMASAETSANFGAWTAPKHPGQEATEGGRS